MANDLESLAEHIDAAIRERGQYLVTAPAEMACIGDYQHAVDFARRHGWMLVSHLHDTNYEFWKGVPGDHVV